MQRGRRGKGYQTPMRGSWSRSARAEGARLCFGLAEWDLARWRRFQRPHLRFLAELTPEQRLEALSATGLLFTRMSLAQQQRLTILAGDTAGWPNGRRPIDDVTDIAVRVVGGTNYLAASDNVDANDVALPASFPFLATPHDGRNRVHANP